MAKKEHPDLILLDVMMPETDGFEICRRLRADPGLTHTPIIILTAMPDPRVNIRGLEAGATMSIRKPFNLDRLIATIKTALALVAKTSAP
jgi:DNA-binding response OmpR family regulator